MGCYMQQLPDAPEHLAFVVFLLVFDLVLVTACSVEKKNVKLMRASNGDTMLFLMFKRFYKEILLITKAFKPIHFRLKMIIS